EMGYWREEGLDAELVLMRAATSVTALASRNVEATTLGGGGLLAILRGLPMRLVFATFNRPHYAIFAKPEIRSLQELKGKKVGVSSIGSGPDSLLQDLLQKRLGDGSKNVAILAVGTGEERILALKRGFVDAAILSPMERLIAEEAGLRELFSFLKEGNYADLPNSLIVREEMIKSDPTLVEKIVRGNLKALLYFRENRAGTSKVLARVLRVNDSYAARLYDDVRLSTTEEGTANEEEQKSSISYLLERAGLKQPPPLDRVYDFSFARKAMSDLKSRGWKP
ncbi:MAG: ABC transporter substrate-binding protein, partial [Deltaproteobacteria bacterium]|nr:ABC transporter substrate-binding protein [Deltaproteobacteria bacterium]